MIDRILAPFLAFAALLAAPIAILLSMLQDAPATSVAKAGILTVPVIQLERVIVTGKRAALSVTGTAKVAQASPLSAAGGISATVSRQPA